MERNSQKHMPNTEPNEASFRDCGQALRAAFSQGADFFEHPFRCGGHEVSLFFLDGLTSGSDIGRFILEPLLALPPCKPEELIRLCLQTTTNAVAELCTDKDSAIRKLLGGYSVLTFPGSMTSVVFETKSGVKRGPEPPEVENTVKGAKDAFTETLRLNTSLVRRHIRCAELEIRETVVGRRSGTRVAVLSLAGVTDPALPKMLLRRLEQLDIDGMLSPAAVEEYLTGSRKTSFPLMRYTERADWFSTGLLSGQAGILVDGLPLGYLTPVNFGLLMTSPEDRGVAYPMATAVRILRYGALLTALLLPAVYLAMAKFHPAMIPMPLLRAMIESKAQVPFSVMAEVLGLLIAFELLQEAGLHLPRSIGHTVSIIGGLVVGSAAVEASLISPVALIIVSTAGICGFAIPDQDLSNAIRVWRFVLAVCAALCGLFGVTMGAIMLLIHLGTLQCCGRPYLAPFSQLRPVGVLLRKRLVTEKVRDPFLRPRDIRKQR